MVVSFLFTHVSVSVAYGQKTFFTTNKCYDIKSQLPLNIAQDKLFYWTDNFAIGKEVPNK